VEPSREKKKAWLLLAYRAARPASFAFRNEKKKLQTVERRKKKEWARQSTFAARGPKGTKREGGGSLFVD